MRLNKDRQRKMRNIKADTDIAPEAMDLLFEVEDVAQVIAEITGADVEVTADSGEVTFDIADENYDSITIEAEGDEEIVEESVRAKKNTRTVSASRRKVTASMNRTKKPIGKTVKRFANNKRK
jgi:seryl-tRNA synthetase